MIKMLIKRSGSFNKYKSQTKHNVFVFFIALFYSLLMVACSESSSNIENINKKTATTEGVNQWFPAVWINGPTYDYQPLYANKTKLSKEFRSSNTIYFTPMGMTFTIESNNPISVEYSILKSNGELVETTYSETRTALNSQSYLFDIVPLDANKYSGDEKYSLEIRVTINEQEAYYYVDLYFNSVDGNLKSVEKVYDYLQKDMKAQNVSFLNTPRFWIDVNSDGTASVRSEFTGATRLEEGFAYKDYIKVFQVDIVNGGIVQESQYIVDKQRYYYNQEDLGWVLGDQVFVGEDTAVFAPYIRHLSEEGGYQLIYSDYELFLYDLNEEEFKEIYRLDAFDSDYIYDEYQHHKIKILDVEANGDVYFAILGYIHDDSENTQKNGIGLYKYTEDGLTNISFMEKEGTISQLDSFITNSSYYSEALKRLYFFDKQTLYMYNIINNDFTYVDTYLKAKFNNKTGILTWIGHDDKYNGGIFVVNLNEEIIKVTDLYQAGTFKRLLGDSDNYIFVGNYDLEDTYEALNGEVIYPFSSVTIYDFNGNMVTTYDHLDYGENIFFSDVYFDDVSNQWLCDLIERQINSKENSKNSRVDFVQLSGPIVLDEFALDRPITENPVEEGIVLKEVYPKGIILAANKKREIIYTDKAIMTTKTGPLIEFLPYPQKDVYKIVDYNGGLVYTSTFSEALQLAREKRNYKIYFSQYSEEIRAEDDLLFDSDSLLTNQYLDEVIVIPQRPELPRGCEVTSLSVLLDYYLDEAPDKIELAENLKSSSIEFKVIDGFVNYSNMHYEFAGSMTDTSEPGLGVYIEPIKKLAELYTNHTPTNITGLSFEQLLTFVSNKQPVLIIIPNRYQAVADYSIEVWKTTSGYMEVTYQEHSVVVMGFDENYVYYSDPSKGIIDKKSKQAFKDAWESFGNQGLVILD